MKLLVLLVICLVLIDAIDCKKHHKKGKEKRRTTQLDASSHEHKAKEGVKHHHRHQNAWQKKNHLQKDNRHKKDNKLRKKGRKNERRGKKNDQKKHVGIREQVRDFQQKINRMLPRCGKSKKCPKDTCCWKGRCKMLPHRLNQRCSIDCPCRDAKNELHCYTKKGRHRRHKYGRCYIKGKAVGVSNVNFIPKTIEKFKAIEKRIAVKKHG